VPLAVATQQVADFLKPFFWNRVEPDHRGALRDAVAGNSRSCAGLKLRFSSARGRPQNDLNKVRVELQAHAKLPLNLPFKGKTAARSRSRSSLSKSA
jgi:hypothetical protein